MNLLLEDTDLAPVLDDVRADLPADLLGLLAEARLAGIGWRAMIRHLDDADLDLLGLLVRHAPADDAHPARIGRIGE